MMSMMIWKMKQEWRGELPYPPSVNHYWRRVGGNMVLSKEGRRYKEAVRLRVLAQAGNLQLQGQIGVMLEVHPPDSRRRDLDNICKAALDALGNAGVYRDDSQIVLLNLYKLDPVQHGRVECVVYTVEGQE